MLGLESISPLQDVAFLESIRDVTFQKQESIEVFHQVGVAEAFRQHSQIVEVSKAGGSSAGALVAAAMLTGLPMQSVMAQVVALRGSS